MITINSYVKPESLEEAYELNQKRANRILGGMMWMRLRTGTDCDRSVRHGIRSDRRIRRGI